MRIIPNGFMIPDITLEQDPSMISDHLQKIIDGSGSSQSHSAAWFQLEPNKDMARNLP